MTGKRRADGPAQGKNQSTDSTSLDGTDVPEEEEAGPVWRRRLWFAAKWSFVAGLACLLIGVMTFVYLYKQTTLPDPNKEFLTETTHVYYAGGKSELGKFAEQQRDVIGYDEMPDCIKDAVVAAENQSFWTDNGIDPKGILRAAFSNAQGNATQGASTITQQFVKVLYLTQERTIKRKVKEALLTLKVQKEMSKEQILAGYLNTIYFGRGAYGIQAAAHAYFEVDAKDLTVPQCAVLASVLNNPSGLDPANGKDSKAALEDRYGYVISSMEEMGKITSTQAEKAERHLPKFPHIAVKDTYGGQRGHALTLIKSELLRLHDANGEPLFTEEQISGGGLQVTTTLTKKAMKAAEQGVKEIRPEGKQFRTDLHAAVASVEPGTGALRGFYAGQDYLKSQLNWAILGGAPGSTFKPFAVAAGLAQGFSLKDTFDGDSPYVLPDDTDVVNEGEGGGFDYGKVSLLKATTESINTAFVDMTLAMEDGPEAIMDAAIAMGVPPANKKHKPNVPGIPNYSGGMDAVTGISLGSMQESPINMANAYATIANDGERANVYVIDKVTSPTGEVLYQHKVSAEPAIDPEIDHDVSYALQKVVEDGTGQNAQALDRPAGGKTGTATDNAGNVKSSWFVGFTPQLATAVMYVRGDGNGQLDGWLPDYNGLSGYFGANYPARTWAAVMERALEGEEVLDLPEPANVDGEAPTNGHDPIPTKTPTKHPTKTPTETPTTSAPPDSHGPSSSPTDSPTWTPPGHVTTSSSPTDCGILTCTSTSSTSSPTATDTTTSPGNHRPAPNYSTYSTYSTPSPGLFARLEEWAYFD